ncbi:MAG: hypothetical protein KIT31_02035 [Deltaproteobacteria bacterium]|nr:hypothetical protein [Deltaproteobacteria bacterium]
MRLRLDASEAEHADQTRRTIEQVVIRRALDELERRVHAQLGERAIVRVRRLAVRWRIDRAQLDDHATAVAMGGDLAEAVLSELVALPAPRRLRPEPEDNAVVFADADHAIAASLADEHDRRAAWFHPPEPAAAVWARVRAMGLERVAATTRWLERMDRVQAIAWLDGIAGSRGIAAVASTEGDEPQPASIPARPHPITRDVTPPGRARPRSTPRIRDVHAAPAPSEPLLTAATSEVPATEAAELELDTAATLTKAAGVWYLARLVMQLDLAEHLWCAGAREGHVLAHVARAVLGEERGDPAWRWFGGCFDDEPSLEPLPDWAVDELDGKLRSALQRQLGADVDLSTAARAFTTPSTISRCAAALCLLFCHRLGAELDLELVRRHLSIPGRLTRTASDLCVEMPMDAIDIDVRRAGLDFDPGYLPWLERNVRIVFA